MSYKKITTSLGGVVILILSVISFIFVPTMIQHGGSASTLGSWDNIKIQNTENSEFTSQYRNLAGFADNQNLVPQDEFSRSSFYHSLAKVAFDCAVIETAIQNELEKAGYIPSDFLVSKSLVQYYLDDTGMYSEAKYKKTPSNTRTMYKKTVENSIISNRFVEDVFGDGKKGGMKTSKAEAEFIKDMAKKVREFKYISFNFDDFPKEEIKKYGLEKINLFDKYDFSVLVYDSEEKAKEVLKDITEKTKTFDEALGEIEVKVLTDDLGKLERSEKGQIAELFPDNAELDKITSLKTGDISDVLKTSSDQYIIIRCDGDVKKADIGDNEIIEKVFIKMKNEDKGIIEEYLLNKAKEISEKAKIDSFDKVAKEYEKEILESSAFSLNYGSLSYFPAIDRSKDSVLENANKDESFYKDVFSLKDGDISKPHLLGSNVVILMQKGEKDSDASASDNTKEYKNQCENYINYYNLVMLLSERGMNYYTIPLSQKTFIEFIEKSPKRIDNHRILFDKDI